jgi:hypothetical protein
MPIGAHSDEGLSGGPSSGLSSSTFGLLGSAAGDIFAGFGADYKARGNELEAENYREASKFATFEAQIQESTTAIQTAQATRQAYQGIGKSEASVAGAGFGGGGSAGDILRSSAEQGALQAAVAHQTGQVAEIGFEEQAKSYANMAEAADLAAKAQRTSGLGSFVTGGLKLAGAALLL